MMLINGLRKQDCAQLKKKNSSIVELKVKRINSYNSFRGRKKFLTNVGTKVGLESWDAQKKQLTTKV